MIWDVLTWCDLPCQTSDSERERTSTLKKLCWFPSPSSTSSTSSSFAPEIPSVQMMYWIYGWNTHGVFMGQQPPMRTLARARLLRIMRLVRILQFVNELRTMVRWWKMGNMPELAAVHNFHTYHMELRLTGPFCLWVDDGTTPNGSFLPVSWWLVNPHPVGHVGGQFHALLGMDHPLDAAHQVHHRRGSEKATFWTRFGHVGSGAKSQKEHRWIGRKLD